MNVYVTVALHQEVLDEVRAYKSQASANSAEKTWLKDNKIPNREVREGKAQNGTEFFVTKCDLNPQLRGATHKVLLSRIHDRNLLSSRGTAS